MMKTRIIIAFQIGLILHSLTIKAQDLWDISMLTRVEVDAGRFHSIRLFEEGLLCKSKNFGNQKIQFFPLTTLELNKLKSLSLFFSTNLIPKDSIIDDSSIVLYSSYKWIKFSFYLNDKWHTIYWIDGKCSYLEICLNQLNSLIPKKKRKLYSINPPQ